jgi:PhzF family phenazine biosynthesis protein
MKLYQLDAFTDKIFTGNPAAVCPLTTWIDDDLMQQIAAENNLAETAFYVPTANGFHIRWFTPTVEVDLCGHATLATAYVVFFKENYDKNEIHFESKSGILIVRKEGDWLVLNFPADVLNSTDTPPNLLESLGNVKPIEILKGKTDYVVVLDNQEDIEKLSPNFGLLSTVPCRGVVVTARSNDVDFVSRFFGPASGINEDPVTGSAHTTLAVYWADKLNKTKFTARQISSCGGFLKLELINNRVEIAGQVRLYMTGEIEGFGF